MEVYTNFGILPHIIEESYLQTFSHSLGTTSACLGLIQGKDCYIPNSVLSEDIRSIVPKPPGKIYAIFKKDINSPLYTQLTYKAKNITITKKCLPEELLNEIDSSLFEN